MKCIARKGLSNTSIGDVATEAGLSQGIVNLHFESKDNLLTETLRTLANEYREQFANPYVAANRGYIDEVIDPAETRAKVIRALAMLEDKRDTLPLKKHGSIPL